MDEYYEARLLEFRNLTEKNLITTLKYYMTQMEYPYKYKPNVPVYDAVFWHIILPELIRRLKRHA